MKEFVDYVKENSSKTEVKMLKAEDGYIIFLPEKAIEEELAGKLLVVQGEEISVKLDLEKLNGTTESKE